MGLINIQFLMAVLATVFLSVPQNEFRPKPPLAVEQQPVEPDSVTTYERLPLSFYSGKYKLSGKLIVPKEIRSNLPVIIFCVGSSAGSTMERYEPFIDSLFLQSLPLDSVALFYFDKRGLGNSEGKWYKTNLEERATDAKAAADFLKTLSFVDKERIAISGHSQGGWITQICMATYPETFIAGLSLAGPTFDVREQIRNDYASTLMCEKQMSEEKARRKALKKVNFHLFLASLFPLREEWKQLNNIKRYNSEKILKTVEKPLWLVFGENDALVSPRFSKDELNRIFPDGVPSNIREVIIEEANHSFKVAEFCQEGSTKLLPYSFAAKSEIRRWADTYLLK